jgi:flagellar hook-length control protein FliK
MMTISNTSMQSALLLSDMPANASLSGQMNIQVSTADGEEISLSENDFFSMLSQNLIQLVSDEDGQVIDNKELMAMIGELDADMETAQDDSLPVQWMQFLKSHFSDQAETGSAVKLMVKDTDQDEEDVISLIDNVSEDSVDIDPVATPVLISATNPKGDALPPERQSLSTRTPKISTVSKLETGQTAVEPDSALDIAPEESDIDSKALVTPENAKKSTEVVNIRQQVTATDTLTIKSVENSANQMQANVTTQISQTPNAASQVLPAHLQSLSVAASSNNQQWGDALGERVSFLINQKLNNAEIRIDPPHLGKLDIQIHIKDDSTQVVIHTQHAQTRDLVENSSFRLREILQDAGYSNVDVNVSHRDSSSNQNASGESQSGADSEQSITQDSSNTSMAAMQQASIAVANGRIDYFA